MNSPEQPNLLDDLPSADNFPEPGQQTPSHLATVEDADDEGDNNLTKKSIPIQYVEPFPGPTGEALRREKTRLELLQKIQESEVKTSWEPFASRAEWESVEWL